VHIAKGLTEAQARAYRIADNQTGSIATWNNELLPIELRDLEAVDFDMSLLGFSDTELSRLMDSGPNPGLTDPDNIPEPPDDPTTKRGDIWILGKHRLMCGDSSNDSDVDRLVAGALIDLTNTDPPYNCKVHSRSNAGLSAPGAGGFPSPSQDKARKAGKLKLPKKMRAKDRPMTNDHVSDEQFFDLLVRWFKNFSRVMRPGRSFYIWGGFSNWRNYCQALDEVGDLHFAQGITWFKHWPVLSRTDFMNDTENAWYGWKEGAPHRFFGESNVSNCWEVKRLHPPSMIHLTEKPVELATRAMQYIPRGRERDRSLWGIRIDPHRSGTERSHSVLDGNRSGVLRCYRPAV
jgi:DNA modification methylase